LALDLSRPPALGRNLPASPTLVYSPDKAAYARTNSNGNREAQQPPSLRASCPVNWADSASCAPACSSRRKANLRLPWESQAVVWLAAVVQSLPCSGSAGGRCF
jgi:hypothetical protein